MAQPQFLRRADLQSLLDTLKGEGYRCLGPQVKAGTLHYEDIRHVDQLPTGYQDQQSPGRYTLVESQGERCFAWANGPQALKPLLFAPRETLWRVERDAQGRLSFADATPEAEPLAVIGVRSCDLAAMKIQDQVFLGDRYRDSHYRGRRRRLFTVAVNCSHPAATCFCADTGDGPVAREGYDIVLTELDDGFLVAAGSAAGEKLIRALPLGEATAAMLQEADRQAQQAAGSQQRRLPAVDIVAGLLARQEHPHWRDVGERCLSCTNCTMVCPTCFCHAETEIPQLDGKASEHLREWDSCFTEGHSYVHGTVLRGEIHLRYRQWLTHKLASWHEQFGSSGCVGCGRCISWCPAAIDITAEVAAIVEDEDA